MGLLSKIKDANAERNKRSLAEVKVKAIERENSQLLANYRRGLDKWNENSRIIESLVDAFQKSVDGKDVVANSAVMKKGEFALWSSAASYHEARKLPGQFVGRSKGISVKTPIKGVRLRAGASKGTFVSGSEVQQIIDRGTVLLTSTRLIFSGNIKTQEWAFAKWAGAEANEDETNYMFHVTNRQKASGVIVPLSQGVLFNRFLAQALDSQREGLDGVLSKLLEGKAEYALEKPVHPQLKDLPTTSALDSPKEK